MHKNYIEIFAFYYKKLMDLEHSLKARLFVAFHKEHGEKCFKVLFAYLKKIENKRKNDYRNKFSTLYNTKMPEHEKLEKTLEDLFFSDLIQLLDEPVFIKNKVRKTFYANKIDPVFFRKNKKPLKGFRNAIAHYNYKDFKKHRKKYVNSLLYFEHIIGCSGGEFIDFNSLPKNDGKKPKVKEILQIIFNQNQAIFKNDKILIEIFDQIAILYGYTYESLPQRWTIIRQKYEIEKSLKKLRVKI